MTQEGINNAKNIIAPFVFKNIKDLQIAEVDFSGGQMTNIDINVPQPDLSDIQMKLDNPQNGLELVANNIDTHMTADFKFKKIITVSGSADIKISKMAVDFEFGVGTQPGAHNELAPKLSVLKTNININPDDVDISLSGSLVAKIASVFIPLIKSSVLPAVVSQITGQIHTIVDGQIDALLAANGTQIEIPYLAGLTIDIAQMGKGVEVTTDGVIMAGLNGTFFDAVKPEVSPLTPATYSLRNPKGKTLQSYMTDYTINTALTSAFETGNTLDITYLLQNYLNLTVTTDNLGVFVPEILTKYGSGKAVGISGAFVKAASVAKLSPTSNTFNGNLAVTIKVGEEVAIQAEFDAIAVDALLSSTSGKIFGKISQSTLGSISNSQNSLGLTAEQLLAELQNVITTNVDVANTELAAGIAIPTILGVNVSDVELNCFDGYIEFGINATPAFFLQAQDAYRFLSAEAQKIRDGEFTAVAYEPIQTLFLQ